MTIISDPNRVFLNWTEPNSYRTESEFFLQKPNQNRTEIKKSILHIPNVKPFTSNTETWRTDWRTNRQIDRIAISILRVSMLTCDKNINRPSEALCHITVACLSAEMWSGLVGVCQLFRKHCYLRPQSHNVSWKPAYLSAASCRYTALAISNLWYQHNKKSMSHLFS